MKDHWANTDNVGWVDGHRPGTDAQRWSALVGEPHQSSDDYMVGLAALDPLYDRLWPKKRSFPTGTRRGITSREVLLGLAIVLVLAAVSWPLVRRPLANHRLSTAVDEVRSQWCQARVEAMRTGRTYEFRYQPGGDHFRTEVQPAVDATASAGVRKEITSAGEKTLASGSIAEPTDMALPDGVKFLADDGGDDDDLLAELEAAEAGDLPESGDWSKPIYFYPDGTATDVEVVLANNASHAVRLMLRGVTGTVTVAELE